MKDHTHTWLSFGCCLFQALRGLIMLFHIQAFFFSFSFLFFVVVLFVVAASPSDAFTVAHYITVLGCVGVGWGHTFSQAALLFSGPASYN